MALVTEAPEEPPPPPEDAVEEEEAFLTEAEPEPEPEPEEDELEAPEEEPPPEDLEPEVASLEEAEPPPPEALAVEGIGSSEGGVALPSGGRSLEEAADAQRRSGRRRSQASEETAQNEEPEAERPERRRPQGPVRLEDAGTPPALRLADPELGYPREFRERALAGRVVVQCVITERGRVRACRARSGPDELADYVISVVHSWDYEPARDHEGQAIAVFYTFRVPFRLL
jgi:TonB family protein